MPCKGESINCQCFCLYRAYFYKQTVHTAPLPTGEGPGVGLFGGGAFGGRGFVGIGFVGLCWALSYLEHKRSDEVVADDTGEIAHESDPCDLLHVPSEGDLLQTHNHYSGCATYDEH